MDEDMPEIVRRRMKYAGVLLDLADDFEKGRKIHPKPNYDNGEGCALQEAAKAVGNGDNMYAIFYEMAGDPADAQDVWSPNDIRDRKGLVAGLRKAATQVLAQGDFPSTEDIY